MPRAPQDYIGDMSSATIDPEMAFAAFDARDRAADGRFVVAVATTRIYCKPSCPARHPRRENVSFYATPAEARAAGYRACLRCRPDEVGRDRTAVADAIALINASETPPSLDEIAGHVGYAPHHFHRLFKRATGVTPAAYARALRSRRAGEALDGGESVTAAIYEAGYAAPSRFYDDAGKRMGMTPSAWIAGGAGTRIAWAVAATSLGPLLVAATARGLCRIAFDEDVANLRERFPAADIVKGDAGFAALVARVVAQVEAPKRDHDLPLDVRGTAFQEAVWQALTRIPAGETLSYAALAAAAGHPGATRAAGTACGANPLAVVVPCHRVLKADGGTGGYAYGPARKRALLTREGVHMATAEG